MARVKSAEKLAKLLEIEGYNDSLDAFNDWVGDSVCPGICMCPDCDYTIEVEPDQDRGWCEECEKNTVKSGLMLGGII